MRLQLTVARADHRTPTRALTTEVEVEAQPGATCQDLVVALVAHLGADGRSPTLRVGGQTVPPQTPLGRAPLLDGAAVTLETGQRAPGPGSGQRPAPRAASRRTPVSLAVAHGPDSGRTIEMVSGRHSVGRSTAADVCLDDARLSRLHAELIVTADGMTIRDLGSTNGTFLDGERIGQDARPVRGGATIALGDTVLVVRPAGAVPAACSTQPDGTRAVNRRPRVLPQLASPAIALPTPPEEPRRIRVPWVAMVVPVPLAAVMAVFFGPTMLAFALMSPLLMAGTALSDRVGSRRTYAAERAEHVRHLGAAMGRVDAACADEARTLRRRLPDPAEVLAVVGGPSCRVWERRRGDPDELAVSLGTCTRPSSVRVIRPAGDDGPEFPPLTRVPCEVSLSTLGVLGLCGDRGPVAGVARSVVGQLLALHSPLDLDVVVVAADEPAAALWSWLCRVPHVRGGDGRGAPRAAVLAADPAGTKALVHELVELVRARGGQPKGSGQPWTGPRTLLVLDGAARLRGLPDLAEVLERGPLVGVSCLAVDQERSQLPTETAAVLDLATPDRPRLELPGPRHRDLAVDRVGHWWADRLSRSLAPLRDAAPGAGSAALPGSVGLVSVAGAHLTSGPAIAELWRREPHATGAPVGTTHGGTFDIDLATDGPHLLVGGTTGSGKSELLRTFVVSLAARNRPEHLSFVLVDYKGGAAFRECARLPHIAGVVTDLDDHLADRALISLFAELKSRERLLAQAGVTDFVAYQRSSSGTASPLARLVIVVDEFRALAEELPAFVDGMVRLAALGRSLGVHVVLATQRPAGVVTADILANVNLRVALRVRDRADSEGIIDAPDAAALDQGTPGRALARLGNGRLVGFQAAHLGGPVDGGRPDGIRVRTLVWGRPAAAWPEATSRDTGPTELTSIVAAAAEAAQQLGAKPARAAWLPVLPDQLQAASLPLPQDDFRARIGLADHPETQSQQPLEVDLATPGHWGFAGSAGSGRSTALLTTAYALTARRGPTQLHLYAVSGGSLSALAALPHCGAHVGWDDVPRLERLVGRLADEVTDRRRLLSASGHATMTQWWAGGTAGDPPPPPPMVLFVDDWDLLVHRTDMVSHGALTERLLALLREGEGVGLRAVVAGDRALLVGRAAAALGHRVVLRLADPGDAALAGLPSSAIPAQQPPGRGVLTDGTEVQLALPAAPDAVTCPEAGDGPATAGPLQVPLTVQGGTTTGGGGGGPLRVDALPTRVDEGQLSVAAASAAAGTTLVGIGGDSLSAQGLSPDVDGRRWLVCGAAGSGVSTTLLLIARSLVRQGRRVAAVSSRAGALDLLHDRPGVLLCRDSSDPTALVSLRRSVPSLAVVVDNAEELLDSPIEAALKEIAALADRDDGVLVCGANAASLALQYRGLAVDVARHRTGILLGPSNLGDADVFGLRIAPDPAAAPGRGHLVRRGCATPIQVAEPSTEPRVVTDPVTDQGSVQPPLSPHRAAV